MRGRSFTLLFFRLIPKGLISRLAGYLSRVHFPSFFLNYIINKYCKSYGVNTDEINYPDRGFRNFDRFFTRTLKKGVHIIDGHKDSVVSPVDARVDQFGTINNNSIIQAKGIDYGVHDLVPSDMADEFINGSFITLYLSPADYHRIHSPVSGNITGCHYIPGTLFPVRDFIVNGIKGVFTKNERVITYINNRKGLTAVCKVGAMNVGRISLSYSDIVTNKFIKRQREYYFSGDKQPFIEKGAELGIFHIGSTVIVLFQEGMIRFQDIETGRGLRLGQKIGSYI
jgi:phosphatidylserine decarboxylase